MICFTGLVIRQIQKGAVPKQSAPFEKIRYKGIIFEMSNVGVATWR